MKSLGENPYDDVVCDAKVGVKSEYSEAELEVVSYLLISCGPWGPGCNKGSG